MDLGSIYFFGPNILCVDVETVCFNVLIIMHACRSRWRCSPLCTYFVMEHLLLLKGSRLIPSPELKYAIS